MGWQRVDQLLIDAGRILSEQGLSGITIVALVYYIMMQRGERREADQSYEVKLAEKDKLIFSLYDRLATQAQAGLRGLEAINRPLADIATKLRGGSTME